MYSPLGNALGRPARRLVGATPSRFSTSLGRPIPRGVGHRVAAAHVIETGDQALERGAGVHGVARGDLALERGVEKVGEAVDLDITGEIGVHDEHGGVAEGGGRITGGVLVAFHHVGVFGGDILFKAVGVILEHGFVRRPADIALGIGSFGTHTLEHLAGAAGDDLDVDAGVRLKVLDDGVVQALASGGIDDQGLLAFGGGTVSPPSAGVLVWPHAATRYAPASSAPEP